MTSFKPAGHPRFRHQKRGLIDIINNRGVHALLFDPGTGKTATVLDYASLLALKSPVAEAKVLVIAPLAAVDTWVEQSQVYVAEGIAVHAEALGGSIRQKCETLIARGRGDFRTGIRRAIAYESRPADGPRLTLLSVNLDTFASRAAATRGGSRTMADLVVEAVNRFGPDLVVVDESHKIKGATSNTSKAIARLVPFVRRRILLTGTVMPHSPLDVYGQWRFLDPEAFGPLQKDGTRRPATYTYFKGMYAEMGGWMGKEIKRFVNLDQMQDIMALRSTVAKKTDALDLPPVTDIEVRVDLSAKEAKAYAEMKKALAVQLESGAFASAGNRLSQLMRLRQITSGYLPDDTGTMNVIGDSKARVVRSLVHDTLAGEKRIVVFAHFRPEIEHLRHSLEARPGEEATEVMTITGDTPAQIRREFRARFGSDAPERIVLIAQIKTMSLAVNELVSASHAVFASLPQQRDDIEQARARLDRQGQTKPVTIWTTVAPGTVDGVILQSYRDRTSLENAMLRHIKGE